jgi:hypothetical protein
MIMNSTARTLGNVIIKISNPERVPQLANPFRVNNGIYYSTQGWSTAVDYHDMTEGLFILPKL